MKHSQTPTCVLFAVLLLALVPLGARAAFVTTYTSVFNYPQWDSGLNSNGQTATWTVGGHVRTQTTEISPGERITEFSTHDNTVCDSTQNGTHEAMMRVKVTSGAGTHSVNLFYNQKTWVQSQAVQTWSSPAEQHTFTYNNEVLQLSWSPTDISTLEQAPGVWDECRYSVGAWQGDQSSYVTSAITPAL